MAVRWMHAQFPKGSSCQLPHPQDGSRCRQNAALARTASAIPNRLSADALCQNPTQRNSCGDSRRPESCQSSRQLHWEGIRSSDCSRAVNSSPSTSSSTCSSNRLAHCAPSDDEERTGPRDTNLFRSTRLRTARSTVAASSGPVQWGSPWCTQYQDRTELRFRFHGQTPTRCRRCSGYEESFCFSRQTLPLHPGRGSPIRIVGTSVRPDRRTATSSSQQCSSPCRTLDPLDREAEPDRSKLEQVST